jgi:glutaredoxin
MFLILGKPDCKYCDLAKGLAVEKGAEYLYVNIVDEYGDNWRQVFADLQVKQRTVPIIYESAGAGTPATIKELASSSDWQLVGTYFEFEEIVNEINLDNDSY